MHLVRRRRINRVALLVLDPLLLGLHLLCILPRVPNLWTDPVSKRGMQYRGQAAILGVGVDRVDGNESQSGTSSGVLTFFISSIFGLSSLLQKTSTVETMILKNSVRRTADEAWN